MKGFDYMRWAKRQIGHVLVQQGWPYGTRRGIIVGVTKNGAFKVKFEKGFVGYAFQRYKLYFKD